MTCPTCKIEMKLGIAIDAGTKELSRAIIFIDKTIEAKHLKLIHVLKCPSCGYSDDGR